MDEKKPVVRKMVDVFSDVERETAMTATGCSLPGSGRSSKVRLRVGASWPLISRTVQPKDSKRAASGSMFMACDVGPAPEKPFASTIATRLPSL